MLASICLAVLSFAIRVVVSTPFALYSNILVVSSFVCYDTVCAAVYQLGDTTNVNSLLPVKVQCGLPTSLSPTPSVSASLSTSASVSPTAPPSATVKSRRRHMQLCGRRSKIPAPSATPSTTPSPTSSAYARTRTHTRTVTRSRTVTTTPSASPNA
jgi:hypothetical protein